MSRKQEHRELDLKAKTDVLKQVINSFNAQALEFEFKPYAGAGAYDRIACVDAYNREILVIDSTLGITNLKDKLFNKISAKGIYQIDIVKHLQSNWHKALNLWYNGIE